MNDVRQVRTVLLWVFEAVDADVAVLTTLAAGAMPRRRDSEWSEAS
jgi:hypothetical protein